MFNQYLNFDDNMLNGAVAESEGISLDEAARKILAYVNGLKQRLDNGEEVSIEGIGRIKSVDGKYDFTEDAQAKACSIDLSACLDEPKDEPEVAPVVAAPVEEKKEAVAPTTTYVYEDEDNKRRNIIIILIISLLFLLGVILCLFVFNKDNCVYNFFFGEKEVVEKVVPVKPVQETVVEEPDTVVAEPIKKIASDRRYNIIVGTYNNEAAAANRVKQLKAKGFENAVVGTFRDNYVAIIDSYDRLPDAEARQEYIVDTYRIESYITNSGE